ncbi:hypothetical protein CRENBAI_010452 [Crenichthys baileyi]|uniref:Uncharacterized protein n=1 Tax=Crenichthys baileyi TaxID=28760 RepID=A0AAV9S1G0_9TELE
MLIVLTVLIANVRCCRQFETRLSFCLYFQTIVLSGFTAELCNGLKKWALFINERKVTQVMVVTAGDQKTATTCWISSFVFAALIQPVVCLVYEQIRDQHRMNHRFSLRLGVNTWFEYCRKANGLLLLSVVKLDEATLSNSVLPSLWVSLAKVVATVTV